MHSKKSTQRLVPAFTLAEVLITLGIIGVVAAMTLPALITEHKKTVLVSRLKKTYSILSQAIVTSESENGNINEWDLGEDYTKANTKRVADKYFMPYLKILKTVDVSNNNGSYDSYGYVLNDGTTLLFSLDGSSKNGYPPQAILITADFSGAGSAGTTKTLDFSKNNFKMEIDKYVGKLRFFTWGKNSYTEDFTRDDLINHKIYGCNQKISKTVRWNCGALIQYDGWQIKDDYPW